MTWEEALRETVLEYEGAPMVWGESDCCQFAKAYLRRLGRDVAPGITYESEFGAQRIMAQHGGLGGFLRHVLGEPHPPEPGDVCLVSLSDEGDLAAAGVYVGYAVFTVHPDRGLVRVNGERVREAWPVV